MHNNAHVAHDVKDIRIKGRHGVRKTGQLESRLVRQLVGVQDEYVVGGPVATSPSIASEAAAGDVSCDVWIDAALPSGPLPPTFTSGHFAVIDGDGLPSTNNVAYPGLGLIEPNTPGMTLPNGGDTLDAFDKGPIPAAINANIFYSLDAGFADPLAGTANSDSAGVNAWRGADILRTPLSGGVTQLYASAASLGPM